MKISLYLTGEDSFRSPGVLARIRERLAEGVAVSSRDHPETFPKGAHCAGDDWSAVLSAKPALAVLDSLVFHEPRAGTFRRWDENECGYRSESAGILESMFQDLKTAGARELILVSEDEEISTGWADFFRRNEVDLVSPDPDADRQPRRRWCLSRDNGAGTVYRYSSGRLLKHETREFSRLFRANFTAPQTEALLALVAEYSQARYEYDNPDDPRALNARNDLCHRIVQSFAESWNPRELLSAVEDLYDLVSEHCDFSRPYPGMGDTGGNNE